MRPRPARAMARQTAAPQRSYEAYSFPGPSLGWVSDQNLAISQPGGAYILDNILPTATGGLLRRGSRLQASLADFELVSSLTGTVATTEDGKTVTGTTTEFETELEEGSIIKIGGVNYTVDTIASDTSLTLVEDAEATLSGVSASLVEFVTSPNVRTLFAYQAGTTNRLFAACDGQIFNVSVSGSPTAAYTVQSGYWSTARYTSTDGTSYVRGVNGVDTPFVYDGTSFTTSPALTFGVGVTTTPEDLSYTWGFKNRFFFLEKNTLDVWYLPVGNIGGELTVFSMGGIFPLGGTLVFGATWSMENGDGLSSMCIFATSNGEVAVYQGDNPADVDSWSKVGVYRIGKPLGPNSFIQRGGDIVVATDIGFIALSQALQKDAPSLSPSALSSPIEDEWNTYVGTRFEKTWAAKVWTEGQTVAIALPTLSGQVPTWLVANARTGRWGRYTGWDAGCLEVFNGGLYFGSPNGKVYEANAGGSDDGLPYVGVWVPTFDQLNKPGNKTVHMARPVLRSRADVNERVSVHSDFSVRLPPSPSVAGVEPSGVWGTAVWGVDIWGGAESEPIIDQKWRNVSGEGETISIAIQVTSSTVAPVDVEFIRTDVTFTTGEMQV